MRLHENFQESFGIVYQLRILNSFDVDQVNRATGTVSIHVCGAKLATVKTTCDVKDSSTREVNQSPVPNVTSIHRKPKTSACQVNPFSHHDYHNYSSFYLHRYIIILVFHLVFINIYGCLNIRFCKSWTDFSALSRHLKRKLFRSHLFAGATYYHYY